MVVWELSYTVGRSEMGEYIVSTVSLVLPDPTGYRFETLVWRGDDEVDGTRYRTEPEAIEGHLWYVALVRNAEYGHHPLDSCECQYCHDAGEVRHPLWGSPTCPEPSVPCPQCGGL